MRRVNCGNFFPKPCATSLEGREESEVSQRIDWDCGSSAHYFKIDDGSLSRGPSDLCRFTFSRADDASAIDNSMLFGKGASEVEDIKGDVEVTSALLKVEKKESDWKPQLCAGKHLVVVYDVC